MTSFCARAGRPIWIGRWTLSRCAGSGRQSPDLHRRASRVWSVAPKEAARLRRIPMSTAEESRGALAIILHTHMPYVEGFGTWPFGEEWLWEAMAGCYLPLLDLLEAGAPLSLSLTPVLCDQLQAPGVKERFGAFVGE